MCTVYSGGENQRTKDKFKKELKKNSDEDEPDDLKIKERKLSKNSTEDRINDEPDVIEQNNQKTPSLKRIPFKIDDESEMIKTNKEKN